MALSITSVADLDDPRLDDYRALPDAGRRQASGLFVVESQLVVERLVSSGRFPVRSVLVTPAALASLRATFEAAALVAPIYVLAPEAVSHVVGFHFHRGCLALGTRPPAVSVPTLLAGLPPGAGRILVCEGVSNPDNLGAVFRNAAAFGAHGVVLGPGCCDPLYRKVIRVSMGAALETPFAVDDAWPASLASLRATGFRVLALAPARDAVDITTLRLRPGDRIALLVGAEGPGLSPVARAAADVVVRIAMAPGVDSLNLATACGIALHRLWSP